MSDLISMDKMPAPYKDLLAKLQPETTFGGENFSTSRRISLNGKVFRKIINGKEVQKLSENHMDIVIVKAAPISRMYYAAAYVEGDTSPPTCWSADTAKGIPSPDVLATDKQSNSCHDCKQNIKGSGQGQGKACRFQQRLAVMLAEGVSHKEIYLLTVPSASIFKDVEHGMTMQAYARFLQAHKTPVAALITEISLDEDSSYPLLTFKPARPLEENELEIVVEMQEHPDTIEATTLKIIPAEEEDLKGFEKEVKTPTKGNGTDTPAIEFRDDKPTAEVEAKVEEPKKKASKKTKIEEETPPQEALDELLDEWDD